MTERFETHARTVSLLTLFSRATGLVRDATLSRIFGAGSLMDGFFLAFLIPNLFRRLFGEGALAAAFLPEYAKLDRDNPKTAAQLATLTVALLLIVLGSVTIIGEAILYFISAGVDHENMVVWLTMIMLPYMPLVCLVAIMGAMLQVRGRFGPTAAAPIVLNSCLIGSAIGVSFLIDSTVEQQRIAHIGIVAASVILAGVVQVMWSLFALRGSSWWTGLKKIRQHSVREAASGSLKKVLFQAGPMIVGLGVLQLNTFFDALIASYPTAIGSTILGYQYPLTEGALAAVNFAQRLYQFPLGVFGIAVATAIFPLLSRQADDDVAFTETIRKGLRMVVFIGLPASAGLLLVAQPLAATILQGGQFTVENTDRVRFVLLGYAPAIWAYSMIHVLTRAFYAKGNAKTPVKIAMSVVVLNVVLNCTLIWTPLKEAGLAWSTAICAMVQVVLLLWLMRRGMSFGIGRDVMSGWMKSLIVTGIMALTVGLMMFALPDAHGWWQSLFVLLVEVIAGMLAVYIAARWLGMKELGWVLGNRK